MRIEIDSDSGFCFGVTAAIRHAEKELQQGEPLYCLGDIVHNDEECKRLYEMGMNTIDHDALHRIKHAKILFRAHGEPPATYQTATDNRNRIIDATCPVVLQLQKRIHKSYQEHAALRDHAQIVIFGKKGHAEVLGLVGQTCGEAIVIEKAADIEQLNFEQPIILYAQTTKSLDEYRHIVADIEQRMAPGVDFEYHDTICRQVAHRMTRLRVFAQTHDVILFVTSPKSSNGKILFHECLAANLASHMIANPNDIERTWFEGAQSVGICGATSTPKWLMAACRKQIEHLLNLS